MGQLLDTYPLWEYWTTWTWREKDDKNGKGFGFVSSWSARRMFERFIKKADSEMDYCFVIEGNRLRHGCHIHAVLGQTDIRRKELWKSWFGKYGRCRLEPYRRDRGGKYYLGKYLTKDIHDWDVKIDDVGGPSESAVGPIPRNVLSSVEKIDLRRDEIVNKAYIQALHDGRVESGRKAYREFCEKALEATV